MPGKSETEECVMCFGTGRIKIPAKSGTYYNQCPACAGRPTPSSAGNNEVGSRTMVDEGAELTTEKRRSPGTDAAPTDSTRSGAEPQGEG